LTFSVEIQNLSPNLCFLLDFLYANSIFAVFGQNVSTANYEGHLYSYFEEKATLKVYIVTKIVIPVSRYGTEKSITFSRPELIFNDVITISVSWFISSATNPFHLPLTMPPHLPSRTKTENVFWALVYFSDPWENILMLWQYLTFYCFRLQTSLN